MKDLKVFCIIVTYNGMQWIERCLDSLQMSSYNFKIIVIDNGSQDRTVDFIKQNYTKVHLMESSKNLGFGQANNIGLKLALENNADYAFLLNQDAWVERDTLSELIAVHIENPSYGIISPLHLNGSGANFDKIFYDYFIESDIRELVTNVIIHQQSFDPLIRTSFVNAAAWLISGDCLKKTGGFDPIFFHYGEDNNYAHRVLFKGFNIGILCTASVCHDKDYNITKEAESIRSIFKQDWIILLHQACDIQNPHYKSLLVRRFCRYSFLTFLGIISFNRNAVFYNFSMAKNIVRYFFRIRTSRSISKNSNTPYL